MAAWFKNKLKRDDESREPLFGSSVKNKSGNAKPQHISMLILYIFLHEI